MKINWLKIFLALVFFGFGVLLSFFYQKRNSVQTQTNTKEQTLESVSETPQPLANIYTETDLNLFSQGSSPDQEKFTITEAQKINCSKNSVQTGEEVTFLTILKNIGLQKKFFTHLCFNHTGGVTFSCLLNVNLDPGMQLPISSTTKFVSPGSYAVWLTWSQDKTNFYQPLQASTCQIQVQ